MSEAKRRGKFKHERKNRYDRNDKKYASQKDFSLEFLKNHRIVSEYDQEVPRSQTANKPMAS